MDPTSQLAQPDRPHRGTCRLAIAGAGLIGRAHAERIQAAADCTLVAVADPFLPKQDADPALNGARRFDDLGALLDSVEVDGVIIATPNDHHRAAVEACVRARVVPLIEKPLAGSIEDGEAIVEALRSARLTSLVGHHRRHSATLRQARQTIADGTIGRVVAVAGVAAFAKPSAYFDVAWRRMPGGGPVLINLVHEIDDLRFLLGDITDIAALTSNTVRGFPVEDTAAVALRFASGALGTFLLTDCAATPWSWEQTSGENAAYDHHPDEACYRVMGTIGALTIPDSTLFTVESASVEPSWTTPLVRRRLDRPTNDPLVAQLRHFVEVIRGEAEPIVDAADGLATLRATIAVLDAARTGTTVRTDKNGT